MSISKVLTLRKYSKPRAAWMVAAHPRAARMVAAHPRAARMVAAHPRAAWMVAAQCCHMESLQHCSFSPGRGQYNNSRYSAQT